MKLCEIQRKRIDYYLNDEWLSDDPHISSSNFANLLAKVDSPLEIHAMVSETDWDAGFEELKQLVFHPQCDIATKLMVFWRCQPDYFCQFNSVDSIPKNDRGLWSFMNAIKEELTESKLKLALINYSPFDDDGVNYVSEFEKNSSNNDSIVKVEHYLKKRVKAYNKLINKDIKS